MGVFLALGRPSHLSRVLLGPGVYAFMNENTKARGNQILRTTATVEYAFHPPTSAR